MARHQAHGLRVEGLQPRILLVDNILHDPRYRTVGFGFRVQGLHGVLVLPEYAQCHLRFCPSTVVAVAEEEHTTMIPNGLMWIVGNEAMENENVI